MNPWTCIKMFNWQKWWWHVKISRYQKTQEFCLGLKHNVCDCDYIKGMVYISWKYYSWHYWFNSLDQGWNENLWLWVYQKKGGWPKLLKKTEVHNNIAREVLIQKFKFKMKLKYVIVGARKERCGDQNFKKTLLLIKTCSKEPKINFPTQINFWMKYFATFL
jgi:hypothetical protein